MFVTLSNKEVLNSESSDAEAGSHAKINRAFRADPSTLLEFIATQRKDTYCNQFYQYVWLPNPALTYGSTPYW